MSIASELSRIQTNRNTIRTKLVELGLAVSTATLDACANAVEDIVNQGAVNASVREGESYTIPKGYHNGSGTVSGVAGGGNYNLQEKSGIIPTKKVQPITPDAGYYGLSSVTVAAIPEAYQDVSATTAAKENVLTGKVFVLADGTVETGTMANNGTVTQKLDVNTIQYTLDVGYYAGGTISITLEEKNVTPTKSVQPITPTDGKVLSKVVVAAIPDEYQDVTPVTATAGVVLEGSVFVDSLGNEVPGGMKNNGSTSKTIDGLTTTSATIPAGYTTGGTVTLTNDIENALAAI